jgi:hypothetical protein
MPTLTGGLHGAYLRTDAVAQLGRYAVKVALADGRLHAPWTGVVVEAGRVLDVWTRCAAATLALGPAAAVCGPSGAEVWGCGAAAGPRTHVLVPPGVSARHRKGLVVHRGSAPADDLTEVQGIPVLALDRVLVDLLCERRMPAHDALAVTDQALAAAGDETAPLRGRLEERLTHRPDRRGTRRAARLLDLATGRAASPAESHLLLVLVDLGFPRPELNWPLASPWGGLLRVLDFAWPQLRIAVEYQGYAVHAGRDAQDEARADDLRRRGWIIEFADAADLRDPRGLAARLREAFTRRGHTW